MRKNGVRSSLDVEVTLGTAAADRHIAGMKSPDSAADEENPPRLAPHAWARSLTDSGDAMFIATADEARGALNSIVNRTDSPPAH